MSEIEKIKKILLFKKNEPARGPEKTHQMGYISALRDVLCIFGENPYFEIPEEVKKFRNPKGRCED